MLTLGIVVAGLGLLLIAGAYQLSTARLTGPNAKRTQLLSEESVTFTPRDLRSPTRILDDRAKLRNTAVVVMEVAVIGMAVWMTLYVYTAEAIAAPYKWAIFAGLAIGALLVGRGLYVRLGLYEPVTARESVRTALGEGVASEYASIGGALSSARSGGEFDVATASVLAAARNDVPVEDLTEWAETHDVTTAETVHERVEALENAGLLVVDDDVLTVEETVARADEQQMASVATSVLN